MDKNLKGIIDKLITNNFIWNLIGPMAKIGVKLDHTRHKLTAPKKKTVIAETPSFFKSLQVLNGPFKGMKYPKLESVGGAIFPKLMGSYESEIQTVIEEFCKKEYSEIIDVGCAEGYYAVGVAKFSDNPKIFAFDTNPAAQGLCAEMAILNNVRDKIIIGSTLTPEMLKNFNFTKRGLIICDCEGYEDTLFNISNISNLKNCDLIIETHDCNNIEISTNLKELLGKSHNIQSIYSIDDIQKALTYKYPQLDGLDLVEKKRLLQEWRKSIMEWLICTPK